MSHHLLARSLDGSYPKNPTGWKKVETPGVYPAEKKIASLTP